MSLKSRGEFNSESIKKGKKEITATIGLSILLYIENLSITKRTVISGMRNTAEILIFWLNS